MLVNVLSVIKELHPTHPDAAYTLHTVNEWNDLPTTKFTDIQEVVRIYEERFLQQEEALSEMYTSR